MDRQMQIQILLDHYERPRNKTVMNDPDVEMPGGNPGCGDVVTMYVKGSDDHEHLHDVSFEGEGCTISMAAASMLMEQVHEDGLTMDEILELDYHEMIEKLGRQVVASRPKCATLGLGTLKAAVRRYQKDQQLAEAGVTRPGGASREEQTEGLIFGEGAGEAAKEGADERPQGGVI